MSSQSRRRLVVFFVLPALAALLLTVLPLVTGERTLFMRDVLNTHYPMKWTQARALADGYLPLVDPWRGGQAHLGNPNTVALYPTNLLLAVASPLWTLNAHFWLHWLLAPLAFYWLAREWGLSRVAAWAAGLCYAGSGFYLANLNLYNLMAGVTLAPALAAAVLRLSAASRRALPFLAVVLLWALLLLGGDPMTAAAAAALALAAPLARDGLRRPRWTAVAGALTLGSVVAAPQLVEFLRILPHSFRGHWGFSEWAATAASFNPATALEWLLPFVFGRPDLGFWGTRFFSGGSPLYFSLYPGLGALLLVLLSGRPRTAAARWAWGLVAVGVFFALGRHNPAVGALLRLGGSGLLRLPIKLWLLVAVGGSLLAGLGAERWLAGGARRRLWAAPALLAAPFALLWALLALPGPAAWLSSWMPPAVAAGERLRAAGLCLLSLALLAAFAALLVAARRLPTAAPAVFLLLHLGSQLALLAPLLPMDAAAHYRAPPPVTAHVPTGARMTQGDAENLFGARRGSFADLPDARLVGLQRRTYAALYPWAASAHGRRPVLATSPEGLDSFVARATVQALPALPDAARVDLLAAAGVERLLLGRPLDAVAGDRVQQLATLDAAGAPLYVYRLARAAPPVRLVGEVAWADSLNAALAALTSPAFDARTRTILAGAGRRLSGPAGSAAVLAAGPEAIDVAVAAAAPAALVLQRSHLPLYRATVDGRATEVHIADLHRLAVRVPAGEHRVRLEVDRWPLAAATAASVAALLLTALVCVRRKRATIGAPATGRVTR